MNATSSNKNPTKERETSAQSVANPRHHHHHLQQKIHLRPSIHIAPKTSPWSEAIPEQDTLTPIVPPLTTMALKPNASNEATATPEVADARSPSSAKTVWYLGGNHAAKLLTSVDGDLDPEMLANLASVPAVVGELALSVESLVSDDFTVGGFENDLLAKIAANTLNARKQAREMTPKEVTKAPSEMSAQSPSPPPASSPSPPPTDSEIPSEEPVVAFTGSVPNPLLENYDPVPNPLARITPPASPTPAIESGSGNNKRKGSPSDEENQHVKKTIRRSDERCTVQAR